MAARKPKPDAFTAHVLAASAKSSSKPIAAALGALVTKRLRSRQRPTVAAQRVIAEQAVSALGAAQFPRRKRSLRRRGRMQSYRSTGKVDISRLGTFRHYMLATIRAHGDTWAAEAAHAACDNPKFAKNRLDFGWAASEGYIEFI